jgi:subtilisin-like proprotein convertase family protein
MFRYIIFVLFSVVLSAEIVIDNNNSEDINDKNCIYKYFDVTEISKVRNVEIDINIGHTYRADLDIYLKSPSGTNVDITTDNGGRKNNLYVNFFDSASESIVDDNSNHSQMVDRSPEGHLSEFYGEDTNGTWELEICDDAKRDTGRFNYARLVIDNSPMSGDLQVDLHMDECYWLGGANGVDDDVKDASINQLDAQSRNKADNTDNNALLCRNGNFVNTYDDANLSDAVFYPNESSDEKNIGQNPPFSVSVWLYRHDDDKWMAGVIKVSDESWEDGWGIDHYKDSGEKIDFFVGSYDNYIRASMSTDTWTHIVGTFDGATMKMYKNGQLVDSKEVDEYNAGTHPIFIGDDVSGNSIDDRWQGSIDEVKVWNRVLNDQEISQIYENERVGKNYDGSERICKSCNGSSVGENSWAMIGIPADLRDGTYSVDDVLGDDMNGSYQDDWVIYERTYSTTDNSSDYRLLDIDDKLEFGKGYWLGSRYSSEWFIDGLPSVDYNSTNSACVNAPCVEIDLTSVTHNFDEDGDDGTGPYRYNLSGFIGLDKPVEWADCRFLVDGVAYTPSDMNDSGYANKQIWLYNGTGVSASDSYTTCDDTMPCKLIPFEGFWVQLLGKTKNKTIKLLIPKE